MATYIKMKIGAVKYLVDATDSKKIDEKLEEGFVVEKDRFGNIVLVDSSSMVKPDTKRVADILDAIKNSQIEKSRVKKVIK